jgi:hypothetical protein
MIQAHDLPSGVLERGSQPGEDVEKALGVRDDQQPLPESETRILEPEAPNSKTETIQGYHAHDKQCPPRTLQ